MANIQELKMLSRIKNSEEGIEFISFLEGLSKQNYEEFKLDLTINNDVYKGKAIALDNIIKLFKNCNDNIIQEVVDNNHWGF